VKAAYILATFPSRTETFALREMQAMTRMGCEITVLAARGDGSPANAPNPIRVRYRPSAWSWESLASLAHVLLHYPLSPARLAALAAEVLLESPRECLLLLANIHTVCCFVRCLDRQRIGHIHAYFLSWPACIGLAVARVSRRSWSISAHARDIFVEGGALRTKARWASFVAVCTLQGLTRLREWLPAWEHDKLRLIRHGIDSSLWSQPFPDASVGRILFVGRLTPKKGAKHLIRAFAMVHSARPESVLAIIGDGPERPDLEGLVRSLHLGDCVEMPGWRDSAAVAESMRRSCLLVVPSVIDADGDRDGVPNVILEAFALGTVVVASRLEGIAEAVRDGQTGVLVAPGDPEELASAILRLLENGDDRSRLREQARAFVERHYDLEKNVTALSELMGQLAG